MKININMKRIIVLVSILIMLCFSISSCKKDNGISPLKTEEKIQNSYDINANIVYDSSFYINYIFNLKNNDTLSGEYGNWNDIAKKRGTSKIKVTINIQEYNDIFFYKFFTNIGLFVNNNYNLIFKNINNNRRYDKYYYINNDIKNIDINYIAFRSFKSKYKNIVIKIKYFDICNYNEDYIYPFDNYNNTTVRLDFTK